MRKLIVILLIIKAFTVQAQDYNVMLIPDSLKENADVVIRNEEYNIIVKSLDKVIIQHQYAITVFNENGDEYAAYSSAYNNYASLQSIDGNLYDAAGKKLKNVKRKDIQDEPLNDGSELMGDTRIKSHNWHWKNYPYTVEYEDEVELKGTYPVPNWYPVQWKNCAVQNSRYTIQFPLDFKLRYKQFNYTTQPQTSNEKNTTLTWSLKNYKAIRYEPFSPPIQKLMPYILVAPNEFVYEGYRGSMETWSDLGKFQLMLNKNRDVLPDNIKKDVHDIADHVTTKEEKVTALYQYMQNNSRYISIQLGIGGWQPFDAKYVAEKKYGDCKALSNYMVALLKEAGVPANFVEIYGGDKVASDYLVEDFPKDYFNHVICCVPNGKDSIWLECTDQTKAAGFMGSFTGNRKALLIADDGGHVVSTPVYKSSDNLQIRNVKAIIDSTGNLDANVTTTFTGIQEELQHSLIYDATKEEREKFLNRAINLPTYKVEKNDYKEDKKRIPAVYEDLHITSPNYASITGKRLFIKPNIFNQSNRRFSKDSVRLYDIYFSSSYKDVDSISILLPTGYTLEAMPKNVSLNSKFGTYSIRYEVKENMVQMLRIDERSAATFPASDYNELVSFYDAIFKADHSQLVFVKKE